MTAGDEKVALQGLIRAAGTFVHRRAGNRAGAEKMAARALKTINHYRDFLPRGFEADRLLAFLADPEAPPPRFGPVTTTASQCQHGAT